MLDIKKIVSGAFQENTYIIWDKKSLESAVIDPGCVSGEEEKIVQKFIHDNKLVVKYLIATHCHLDHVAGCKFIKEKYNPEYYIPEEDLPLHQNASQQAAAFRIQINTPPAPDKYITEDFKQILQNISAIAEKQHTKSPINETFFLENSIVSETNSHGIKQTDKIIVSFNSRFNNQVLVNVKTPKITKPIHVPISKELKDTPLKQKQLREKVILYKILGDNMLSTFYSELKIQTTDYFNHKIQGLTFRSLLSFNLKYYEGSIQTIGIICLKYLVNTNNIRFTLSKADLLNLNEYLSGI